MNSIKFKVSEEDHKLLGDLKESRNLCLTWGEFFLMLAFPEKYDPLFKKVRSREEKVIDFVIDQQKVHVALSERIDSLLELGTNLHRRVKDLESNVVDK